MIMMVEYQRLINGLRCCRADLTEKSIVKEIQKLSSSGLLNAHQNLAICINSAEKGEPMPWEKS